MNVSPITGMNNIVTIPTNVCKPLKSLKKLAIPHTVAPSRGNTYIIMFQSHGTEHLVANERYFDSLPNEVEFHKQFPKKACLPQ